MPTSAAISAGPVVSDSTVTFRFADPDRALSGVRLSQDVRIPGDQLDFRRGPDGDWALRVDRPDVHRIEYAFVLTHPDGSTEQVLDPANAERCRGAFGDKSVVLLPGYEPPDWCGATVDAAAGDVRELAIPARALGTAVQIRLWTPPDGADDEPLPLIAVHDGPEYDELSALTAYLATMVGRGALPRVRAALLSPGHRDDWYSANGAYTRALCLAILPNLRSLVTTTVSVGMGTSLGALAMLHAQRRHAGTFDALFLQSGSFFHPRFDAQERRFPYYDRIVRSVDSVLRAVGHRSPVPVVMTCGRIEENIDNNRMMARALAAQGYDVALHEFPDVHNYTAWRDSFDPCLTRLVRMVAS